MLTSIYDLLSQDVRLRFKRFAETSAEADGAFTFTNLAPGKYFVLPRAIPKSESGNKLIHPAAWGTAERKKLRKEAEAANLAVELKPCQRTTGYALRLDKVKE